MTDEIQFRDANMRDAQPVLSVRGLALPAGDRGEELLLRVTAPLVGKGLPVTRGADYYHDDSLGIWDLEGLDAGKP